LGGAVSITVNVTELDVTVEPDAEILVDIASVGLPGPAGSGAGVSGIVAPGHSVAAGRAVALLGGIVGYVADFPSGGDDRRVVGVSLNSASAGGTVNIATSGPAANAGAGYTPNATYYTSSTALAGELTVSAPTTGTVVSVGYATDANTLFVQIGTYVEMLT
jgi:hypothetical protein